MFAWRLQPKPALSLSSLIKCVQCWNLTRFSCLHARMTLQMSLVQLFSNILQRRLPRVFTKQVHNCACCTCGNVSCVSECVRAGHRAVDDVSLYQLGNYPYDIHLQMMQILRALVLVCGIACGINAKVRVTMKLPSIAVRNVWNRLCSGICLSALRSDHLYDEDT